MGMKKPKYKDLVICKQKKKKIKTDIIDVAF